MTRNRRAPGDLTPDEARAIVDALKNDLVDAVIGCQGVALLRLKEAEDLFERTHDELEQRVAERTAEATRRSEQLRSLALQLTEAEERERRRLAVMLHDGLQQELVAIRFQLEMLARRIDDDAASSMVSDAEDTVNLSIQSCRSLSMELSPPLLHQEGLAAALEWLGQSFADKHGLDVRIETEPGVRIRDERLRVFLFQTAREALLNVVKHAATDTALLRLGRLDDRLEISVEDRGSGFETAELDNGSRNVTGFGLLSVRERADLLGTDFSITSTPGGGTRVSLTWSDRGSRTAAAAPEDRPENREYAWFRQSPSQPSTPLRVLLVDDHAMMRHGLRTLIELEPDLEVVGEADTGAEGVSAAIELAPDVVVIDVAMPGLNGIEATRRITEQRPDIRVIGLSMFDDRMAERDMLEAGAEVYLTKTGPSRDLLAAIRGRDRTAPPGDDTS